MSSETHPPHAEAPLDGGEDAARPAGERATRLAGEEATGPADEDAALRTILEGTATATGERFFQELVRNLARALDTRGAWVTEYLEEGRRLRALAFWLGDGFVQEYEYALPGTPCDAVIEQLRLIHIPDNVIELFPEDPDLPEIGAVSYMGMPLSDLDGRVLGHLAVVDDEPLPEAPRVQAIFQIFAARAAAELQRLRAETEVREREEKLGRLVGSAMDAILEVDSGLRVTMANPAAERVFGLPAPQLVGRDFPALLAEESADRLRGLMAELAGAGEGSRSVWIPGGLEATPPGRDPFPAEATLSCYEARRSLFFTLILRDLNERLEAERRIRSLTNEAEYLREEVRELQGFDEIIGRSPAMLRALRAVAQVAGTDSTVLITGETGTGKELFARAIHAASRRAERPLVRVNCAAIPDGLIESELFGHEKGAFTGATQRRTGRFALAHQGTLFLDEVGELPADLQAKLLRVLQEGEFEPVGSSQTRSVDVRVIAATNRDLRAEVEAGRFREDLFYRLHVFPIEVPPLRERREDVAPLARAFAERFARDIGREVRPPSAAQLRRLEAYDWPGNVRELQNVIERAVITSHAGQLNLEGAIPAGSRAPRSGVAAGGAGVRLGSGGGETGDEDGSEGEPRILTEDELRELERENVRRALEATGWRVSGPEGAARLLGIPPSTLSSRMKSLGIERP